MIYDPSRMTWRKRQCGHEAAEETMSTDPFASTVADNVRVTHASALRHQISASSSHSSSIKGAEMITANQDHMPFSASPSPSRQVNPKSSLKSFAGLTPIRARRGTVLANVSVSFVDSMPEILENVAHLALEETFTADSPEDTSQLSRTSLRASARQSLRRVLTDSKGKSKDWTAQDSAWLDRTALTELSFAIAQDRVLQVLTDVVPWQADWENLSQLDLSRRRVETLVTLQDFCPNLLEINL